VQAAINAGASLLPADLPAPPVYAKINPADAPVLTLAVTSDTLPLTEVQKYREYAPGVEDQPGSAGVGLVSLSGGQPAGSADSSRFQGASFVRPRARHAAHRDYGG